ncbi:MAG: LCP family protein [Acidimicrobiia bacterium]
MNRVHWKTFRRAAGLSVLSVAIGLAGSLVWWLNSGATVFSVTRTANASQEWTPNAPLFVLLVGDDLRPGAGCKCADSIHLVGIPAGGGQAVMMGIPRDTRVSVPGRGNKRINDAWNAGGNELMAQVAGELVGVPVSYVVHVNYTQLPKLVDEIGGLDVDVPTKMSDRNSGAFFPAGVVHMNGDQVLAFSRNRHIGGGDFKRSENQGLVILSALAKMRAEGTGKVDTMKQLGILMRHTDTTGMGTTELWRLARVAIAVDAANVRNVVMPGKSASVGGASYVVPTPEAAAFFADFADDAILQSH